jgi:hypothetical protein
MESYTKTLSRTLLANRRQIIWDCRCGSDTMLVGHVHDLSENAKHQRRHKGLPVSWITNYRH